MNKLKLQLEDLLIDSFQTAPAEKPEGTVFGEQSGYATCGGPTCNASCRNSCVEAETCAWSCGGTCYDTCKCNWNTEFC